MLYIKPYIAKVCSKAILPSPTLKDLSLQRVDNKNDELRMGLLWLTGWY